jgi:3-hydroxyisobutyrate dehydrogenase
MRVIVATPTNVALVEKTMTDYEKLMEQGHGDEDISSLYRLKLHS